MTSLVTEALASAGSLAKDDWNTKVSKLSARAFDVKRDVSEFIEQSYIDFSPQLTSSDSINSKLASIQREATDLQQSLDTMIKNQIEDSTKEYEKIVVEHLKTSKLVEVLEKLYSIHIAFQDHDSHLQLKNILQAATTISKLQKLLDSFEENELVELAICKALKMEFLAHKETIQCALDEAWRSSIQLILPTDDEESETKITIDFSNQTVASSGQDIVGALFECENIKFKMQRLSKIFMENFLKPFITDESLRPCVKLSTNAVLWVEKDTNLNTEKTQISPEQVFDKVLTALKFLYEHLLKFRLLPDAKEGIDNHLMRLFCDNVRHELITILIDQCLMKSIPNSKDELQHYKKVEETVVKFEKSLTEIGFLTEDQLEKEGGLVGFVSNIHVHFANQRCTAILSSARQSMKMNLQETVKIEGEEYEKLSARVLEKLKPDVRNEKSQVVEMTSRLLKPSKPMDDRTLCLPKFRISKGAKEVVDLAYKTLHEATSSSPECAMRLVVTTQNIFELFSAVAPTYHKESLRNLPQAAALHYNDCWYIAHHLLTMGHQFSKYLPTKDCGVELTFVHQVPMIRQLGSECLLMQMRRQRNILDEFLAPLKTFASDPNSDKYTVAERPIKQVMHQLQHLRKVWVDVFPHNILQSALATLVDSVIAEVVGSVCTMQDISSDDSVQLNMVCCLLQDQIHSLFSPPDDNESKDDRLLWQREVRKWQRLSELILVLDASLHDIVDRWADGKGPLSGSFTVVEVKGLIRALFQNTDRRANAISKIRY